jgi:sugar transferase (PEP-CTERM/EpsH1 system associated)
MKRNLIFISHRIPWPLNKGEKIRGWNVIQHLRREFDVHLGCVVDDPADMAHADRLREACASVGAFPIDRTRQKIRALLHARPGKPLMPDFYYSPALHRWVNETMARVEMDIVYIYSVAMGPYALRLKRPQLGLPRLILDAQDIDSEKWTEYAATARLPMRAVWAREGRTLLAYERMAAARCDATFFVSEPEARRFMELAPEVAAKTDWVENGVDLERFSPALEFASPFTGGVPFVFTGNMDYWPNADAVIWFANEVMPRLRAAVPAAEFWVVGANPGPSVQALAALPGVHVTGRVPDTRPYVAHAAACVCPLRIARGIQNKVLEGMAMGRPVIASPAAFEGVRAEAGRDLLVAEGVDGFLAAIDAVLAGVHAGLGERGRAAMVAGYAWPQVMRRMDRWIGKKDSASF